MRELLVRCKIEAGVFWLGRLLRGAMSRESRLVQPLPTFSAGGRTLAGLAVILTVISVTVDPHISFSRHDYASVLAVIAKKI